MINPPSAPLTAGRYRHQFAERQFLDSAALCGFTEITCPATVENQLPDGLLPLKYACIASNIKEGSELVLRIYGSPFPAACAELISFASELFARLGLMGVRLELSHGERGDSAYFEELQKMLDALHLDFSVSRELSFDGCVGTAFAFSAGNAVLCRGGQMESSGLPVIGCAIGEEALLALLEAQQVELPPPPCCDLYIGSEDEASALRAMALAADLRGEGFFAQSDLMGRGLAAQREYARQTGAKFWTALSGRELRDGKAAVQNLSTGETAEIDLDSDALSRFLYDVEISKITDGLDAANLQQMMEGLTF